MYYPKSQIKTDLYTKGNELYYLDNRNQSYTGYYYQVSSGKYFTGKSPADKPNNELVPGDRFPVPKTGQTNESPTTSFSNTYNIVDRGYYRSKNYINNPPPTPNPPTQYYPILTQADYDLGEFQRYFLKKANEVKYIEINKTEYNKYVSKLEVVPFQLYIPFSIPWEISGDRSKVYNTNKQTVELKQQRQQLPGFKSYFRERYDQFYK